MGSNVMGFEKVVILPSYLSTSPFTNTDETATSGEAPALLGDYLDVSQNRPENALPGVLVRDNMGFSETLLHLSGT